MFRPRLFQPFSHRVMRHAATVLALVLLAGAIGAAAPRLAGDLTPGKLPKSVVPTHYAIDLELNPDTLKVDGFEVIDIEVREPTTRLVLNTDEVKVTRATIDRKPRGATITYDDDAETVTLTFPRPLEVGSHKLRIAFTAQIHRSGPGLYYVDYRTDSGNKRLISSHLAPADARRVFPVWDEPGLKATLGAHRHGAARLHGRQQHAGGARGPGRAERQEDLLFDQPKNVELSPRTDGG